MKAGASKINITPDSEVYLSGFPRGRRSKGVHDDLWARCLSLSNGSTLLSIVTADLWAVLREDIDEIARELKPKDNEHLLVCSTHVDSSPDMLGMFGPDSRTSGTDETYVEKFRSAVVRCVEESRASMKDVTIRVAAGRPNLKIENLRDPSRVNGTGLTVYFAEKGGRSVHSLTSSSAPAVVTGEESALVSCDWLHSFYTKTEQKMGGIPLFLQGPLGGAMYSTVTQRSFDEASKIGNIMADYVIGNYPKSDETKGSEVSAVEKVVEVPVENRLMMALSAIGTFRGQMHNKRKTRVVVVRLGPLTMATLPGSAFPEVAYEIKAMMRSQHRVVVSFADDYVGFIIPQSKFDPTMYEERISLGREVAKVLTTEMGPYLSGQ